MPNEKWGVAESAAVISEYQNLKLEPVIQPTREQEMVLRDERLTVIGPEHELRMSERERQPENQSDTDLMALLNAVVKTMKMTGRSVRIATG